MFPIRKISQDGVVTCVDNRKHELIDGDWITFKEVRGMEEINGKLFKVKIVSP